MDNIAFITCTFKSEYLSAESRNCVLEAPRALKVCFLLFAAFNVVLENKTLVYSKTSLQGEVEGTRD